jgi:hypothetical protein
MASSVPLRAPVKVFEHVRRRAIAAMQGANACSVRVRPVKGSSVASAAPCGRDAFASAASGANAADRRAE